MDGWRAWEKSVIRNFGEMKLKQADDARTLRGENGYAAIAEGYVNGAGGWCILRFFPCLEQVWIDSKLLIDNSSEVKSISHRDNCCSFG